MFVSISQTTQAKHKPCFFENFFLKGLYFCKIMMYNKNMKLKEMKKQTKAKKMKIGIAFGGGGTRGFAHIGALKAFEEEGIHFDEVAGTSVGSIIGALYAYGLTADEMIEIGKNIKPKSIRNKLLLSDTTSIQELIKQSIGDVLIEELKIPFTAVAVDIKSGKEVHLTKGSVCQAVAGSCAVPLIFKPVEYKGYRLFDGGLTNTIPADVLKNNGCDVIISIDVNPTRGVGTESLKVMDQLNANLGILMRSNAIKGKIFSNVCIEPYLKDFKSTKMAGYQEMIAIGYQETKNRMPEIKELLKKQGFWASLFHKNKKKPFEEDTQEIIIE